MFMAISVFPTFLVMALLYCDLHGTIHFFGTAYLTFR